LFVGLRAPEALDTIRVLARIDRGSPWIEITRPTKGVALRREAPGLQVPLRWPAAWRSRGAIAEELKIVMTFRAHTRVATIDRLALYPRNDAPTPAAYRCQQTTPAAIR